MPRSASTNGSVVDDAREVRRLVAASGSAASAATGSPSASSTAASSISSLLGGPGGVELLPPAEMLFRDYPHGKPRIVDYAAKWDAGSFEFRNTLRRFDVRRGGRPLLARLEDVAKACWRLFGLSGYARVDFRVDARRPTLGA